MKHNASKQQNLQDVCKYCQPVLLEIATSRQKLNRLHAAHEPQSEHEAFLKLLLKHKELLAYCLQEALSKRCWSGVPYSHSVLQSTYVVARLTASCGNTETLNTKDVDVPIATQDHELHPVLPELNSCTWAQNSAMQCRNMSSGCNMRLISLACTHS